MENKCIWLASQIPEMNSFHMPFQRQTEERVDQNDLPMIHFISCKIHFIEE